MGYQSKLEKTIRNHVITIDFMKVAIAAKGVKFVNHKTGGNLTNSEWCIEQIKRLYVNYNEFKNFVLSCDLNKSNQTSLYKYYKNVITEAEAAAKVVASAAATEAAAFAAAVADAIPEDIEE
jgi:hypothetical protein